MTHEPMSPTTGATISTFESISLGSMSIWINFFGSVPQAFPLPCDEEVGQPYDVRLVSFSAMKEPAHLALHPFGQIPTYEEGDLALFESGAIVFHIASAMRVCCRRCQCPGARDHVDVRRAQHGGAADRRSRNRQLPERDKTWYEERLPIVEDRIRDRLGQLSAALAMPTGSTVCSAPVT